MPSVAATSYKARVCRLFQWNATIDNWVVLQVLTYARSIKLADNAQAI